MASQSLKEGYHSLTQHAPLNFVLPLIIEVIFCEPAEKLVIFCELVKKLEEKLGHLDANPLEKLGHLDANPLFSQVRGQGP